MRLPPDPPGHELLTFALVGIALGALAYLAQTAAGLLLLALGAR